MRRKKVKNTILKAIMAIVFFVWCFAACCLDSETYMIPLAVCIVTGAILTLFAYANCWFEGCEI